MWNLVCVNEMFCVSQMLEWANTWVHRHLPGLYGNGNKRATTVVVCEIYNITDCRYAILPVYSLCIIPGW